MGAEEIGGHGSYSHGAFPTLFLYEQQKPDTMANDKIASLIDKGLTGVGLVVETGLMAEMAFEAYRTPRGEEDR